MWAYSGLSCPDRPSSEELSVVEVEALKSIRSWISGSNRTPVLGPIPYRGIASVRVSTSSLFSVAFTILSFHCALDPMQGLRGGNGKPRDANSPSDATRR
jgi:hypothetical protein